MAKDDDAMEGPSGVQDTLVDRRLVLEVLHRVNVLAEADRMSVDIGGSLAKLLYIQPDELPSSPGARPRRLLVDSLEEGTGNNRKRNKTLSFHIPALGGTAHFFSFETRNVEELIHFLVKNWGREVSVVSSASSSTTSSPSRRAPTAPITNSNGTTLRLRATGGGAYKYAQLFAKETGCELRCLDEMRANVTGLNFLLTRVDREVYTVKDDYPANGSADKNFQGRTDAPFPYLLVNIGSGVSIVMVTGHNQFTRVSGSALGGGTFWGLARLLTNCRTFDEIIELTKNADNANVDMLVRDIYAGDYTKLGLDANIVAASFGRITMKKETPYVSFSQAWKNFVRAVAGTLLLWLTVLLSIPGIGHVLRYFELDNRVDRGLANSRLRSQFSAKDVALSLLRMVSYNIGQIAYLNAQRFNLNRIYFGGNFIRNHPYTIAAISFSVRFWSGGKTEALFLNHDGFLGTLGAFILGDSDLCDNLDTASKVDKKEEPKSETVKKKKKKKSTKPASDHTPTKITPRMGSAAEATERQPVDDSSNSTDVPIEEEWIVASSRKGRRRKASGK